MLARRVMAPAKQTQDFQSYLQQELLRRCKANPKYSLRAFASVLQIESSALSKILNGKRRVSTPTFEKLASRLGLGPHERDQLRPGVLKRSRGAALDQSTDAAPNYQQLSLDLFQVIADWYHYAILELTQVAHFKADKKWIARTLGITPTEVNLAVQRLTRLELLQIDKSGRWTDISGATTNIKNDFTAVALRKLQRQILEHSVVALEEIPVERRDHTSMTMAVSSKTLPVAKEKIKKFRRELCALMKAQTPYDDVYQLAVSLYPVTKRKNAPKGCGI